VIAEVQISLQAKRPILGRSSLSFPLTPQLRKGPFDVASKTVRETVFVLLEGGSERGGEIEGTQLPWRCLPGAFNCPLEEMGKEGDQ
jgi:hypothetical protein